MSSIWMDDVLNLTLNMLLDNVAMNLAYNIAYMICFYNKRFQRYERVVVVAL